MSKVNCIDVSAFQSNIDFNKVKKDGIKAVIIRAGYGREASQKDSEFETHYKNAKVAGLKIGAYWYSYADSVEDAEREAKACLECIKGKSFDMPVYYDLEDNSQTNMGKATLTAIAKKFCETIKSAGYRAGVYANLNWFNNYLDYSELKKLYSIWLAQYNVTNQLECDIWQNSSTGNISGVNGDVDTDIIFNENVISNDTTSDTENSKPSDSPHSNDTKPDVYYCVRTTKGKWLPKVKNLEDYAGLEGVSITDVAIKVSKGSVKYRVHINGGDWLPYVTGYDAKDPVNGYAGNGSVIDAIEVYYNTPSDIVKSEGYLKAKYRVSPLNSNYYPYQFDDEKTDGQDGYAGAFGVSFDKLQIVLV